MSLFDKKYLKRIDWVTVGIVLALVVFGTIALASVQAKPFDGTEHGIADYMDKLNMEYLQKHITNFLVGLAAMIIFLVFDYSIFKTFAMWAYIGIIGLLMLLFIFGKVRGGAQGWFVFDTLERAIQPGELSKDRIDRDAFKIRLCRNGQGRAIAEIQGRYDCSRHNIRSVHADSSPT